MANADDKHDEVPPGSYSRGSKWPATVLLLLPFLLVLKPLYRSIRNDVNRRALLLTIAVFEVVMFCSEHFSVSRGNWVWNEARILGPKIWGVPIEEPLLYYWVPVVFVVTLFHVIRKKLMKKEAA